MTFGDVVLPGLIPLFGAFIGALIANFFPIKTPLKVQGVFYGFIGGFFVSAAFWSMTHYEFMLRIRFEKAAFSSRSQSVFFLAFSSCRRFLRLREFIAARREKLEPVFERRQNFLLPSRSTLSRGASRSDVALILTTWRTYGNWRMKRRCRT